MQRLVSLFDFLFSALILFAQEAEFFFVLVFGFLKDFGSLGLLYFCELLILILVRSLPSGKMSRWRCIQRLAIHKVKTGVTVAHAFHGAHPGGLTQ